MKAKRKLELIEHTIKELSERSAVEHPLFHEALELLDRAEQLDDEREYLKVMLTIANECTCRAMASSHNQRERRDEA